MLSFLRDAAVGVGVQRHFLSLAMSRLQNGFNINSGMSVMVKLDFVKHGCFLGHLYTKISSLISRN